MHNTERIVIYSSLLLLGMLNVAVLAGGGGGRALAGAGSSSGLGPADSLTLVDGGDELVLRNRGGRLGWADDDFARAHSIAFVHVGRAMGPLLEAERYVEEYSRAEGEIREAAEEVNQRIVDFQQEHQNVAPDDPDAQQIQQAFQALLQEREQLRMDSTRRLGELAASQIERAYRDLVAAVEVVADRRHIDIVYRFIPTANEFEAVNPPQAYTGIRARIALRYPKSLDITDAVLEELDLALE